MGGEESIDVLDDTGRLWRLRSLPDRPRSDFVWSTGEVTDELYQTQDFVSPDPTISKLWMDGNRTNLKTRVTGLRNLAQRARRPDLLLFLGLLLVRHRCKALLKSDGEGDERITRVLFVDPGFDFRQPALNGQTSRKLVNYEWEQ